MISKGAVVTGRELQTSSLAFGDVPWRASRLHSTTCKDRIAWPRFGEIAIGLCAPGQVGFVLFSEAQPLFWSAVLDGFNGVRRHAKRPSIATWSDGTGPMFFL